MTQGRQVYLVKVNTNDQGEAVTELRLTILPALQAAFMKSGIHDVAAATAVLRNSVKGFWVEMPLEWGIGESKTPEPPVGPQMIANNATKKPAPLNQG